MNREPTVLIGGIAEIVRAIIPMLLIFGVVQWTDAQTGTVVLLIGVVVGVAEKWFTRSNTVAKDVADKQIEIAKAADANTPTSVIVARAKENV